MSRKFEIMSCELGVFEGAGSLMRLVMSAGIIVKVLDNMGFVRSLLVRLYEVVRVDLHISKINTNFAAGICIVLFLEMENKNKLPYYYNTPRNVALWVTSTTVFVELFILIFTPFQSRTWANNDMQYLRWVTVVVLVAMAVIAISRTVMYFYAQKRDIGYPTYAIWIFMELTMMALIYSVFPFVVIPDFAASKGLTFFGMFKEAMIDTAFILLIPYTIIYLIINLQEKNKEIQQLTQHTAPEKQPDMFNFYDDKGELKLSVKPEMVYYIEAADNYVEVHYMSNGKKQNMLVRNSLKNIAWSFNDQELVRCHRSYIANLSKVQLLRRIDGEMMLDFGDESIPKVPVSRGYAKDVIERFSKN